MVEVLKLLAFVWLAYWALRSSLWISKGRKYPVLFVILVHFLFSGIPIIRNLIFGYPVYSNKPNFSLATQDTTTNIIYYLYISFAVLVFWYVGKDDRKRAGSTPLTGKKGLDRLRKNRFAGLIKPIPYILLVLPVVSLAFAPEPSIYLEYGAVLTSEELAYTGHTSVFSLFQDPDRYHSLIGTLTNLSLIGAIWIIATIRRINVSSLLLVAVFLGSSIWLKGKRNIVAIAVFLVTYVLWYRGTLKGKRLFVAFAVAAAMIGIYSFLYQISLRDALLMGKNEMYENISIDYGRDHVIKFTIFSELNRETYPVLEYRGQSLLFNLVFLVPRELWPDKPWPYSVYFTSAVYSIQPARYIGWGYTTSLLGEAISNFSWAGLLIGPLAIALFCRLGEAENPLSNSLTALLASLLLAVSASPFLPLFYLWGVLVLWSHTLKNKRIVFQWQ